ncbi:hypothetical protein A1F94_011843 [Pyrenophora tritici-repentis]|uniref:Uncharacterized protein n=2 Tax=Pyrenophora tritici-repentis TaxID=45151 RepID=A0A2W1F1V8_9PLEO|nr:uncharacterized protein PTRG_00125 [Pyrenophora tritici-repentis Pt-1C-BFP]KAF7453104.1 hypothetical protein A1F99_003620 [Pyrenophora tritici-repentis]EDU39563.1 predicted protein [Pyrenophora tritici-repentis Pt-1C-BFP]KAG9377440.1 hypothetical protein A1F94_011843 [Pyrenophora tritici-repentis]KAI1520003.1 hypothetical protein Ptr86124_000371 [Pyrenophora tritici-repentis]KAI1675612.1 hypothetical protein L13192_02359 [Pyrenophora tritici-repentis]
MVLYHANGRVVIAHETYLENLAQQVANSYKYVDQVHEYNKRNRPVHADNQVEIHIEEQIFKTVGGYRSGSDWEHLDAFDNAAVTIGRVDRATLRFVSNLADDHFRYNPDNNRLCLPVRYPRAHMGQTSGYTDERFADYFSPSQEITQFIFPWLLEVKEIVNPEKVPNQQNPTPPAPITLPSMQMPDDFVGKIHLYNAMLQLGLPKSIQKPLIDALVLQMYQTTLNACHLDVLEITVGRFHARSLPVLDTVLNHFAGTYAFRPPEDR